jgi:hypothetical protein
MTRLAEYGSPLFTYSGLGTVYFEGGLTRAVEFDAGQTREGTAWVLTTAPNASFDRREPLRFEGETSSGDRVSTSGLLMAQAYLPEVDTPGLHAAFRARELRFDRGATGPVREYRFGLSNAAIWGVEVTEYVTDGGRRKCRGIPIRLPMGAGGAVAATLVQIADAERRKLRVMTLRDIDVLSELIVPFQGTLDPEEVEQGVKDACYVLSVARGTKVNWAYREERDGEGTLMARVHRSVITKAYTPCAPIDDRPELAEATRALLADGTAQVRDRHTYARAAKLEHGSFELSHTS